MKNKINQMLDYCFPGITPNNIGVIRELAEQLILGTSISYSDNLWNSMIKFANTHTGCFTLKRVLTCLNYLNSVADSLCKTDYDLDFDYTLQRIICECYCLINNVTPYDPMPAENIWISGIGWHNRNSCEDLIDRVPKRIETSPLFLYRIDGDVPDEELPFNI